ncbi:SdrD B-like domain-containing protein [Goodfellowiella coeruleoviolacea]|nr:SdrD B-like domain-containing protein [Goodfellowiella coeruleoviolacea]
MAVSAAGAVGSALLLTGTAAAAADASGAISGQIWLDRDGNGVFDGGERPYGVVRPVPITKLDGTWSGSATLGLDGRFTAEGLRPGRYLVNGGIDGYASTTSRVALARVTAGGTAEVEFGIRGGSISGVAWLDENEDGIRQDAEPPLPQQIHVFAYRANPPYYDGAQIDPQGHYRIEDLPAGEYRMSTSVLSGFGPTRPFVGSADRDSDVGWDAATTRTVTVEVADNGTVTSPTHIDAGFVRGRGDRVAEELTASPAGGVQVGQTVSFHAVVANRGNTVDTYQGKLTLPAGLEFVDATSVVEHSVSGQVITVGKWGHDYAPGVLELWVTALVTAVPTEPVRLEAVPAGTVPGLPETNVDNNVRTLTL